MEFRDRIPTDASTQVQGGQGDASSASQQVLGSGGPIVGVASINKNTTIREFNHKKKYNEWQFIYDPANDRGNLITTPNQPALQVSGIPGFECANRRHEWKSVRTIESIRTIESVRAVIRLWKHSEPGRSFGASATVVEFPATIIEAIHKQNFAPKETASSRDEAVSYFSKCLHGSILPPSDERTN